MAMRVETPSEQLFFVTAIVAAKGANDSSWTGTGFVYAVSTDRGAVHFLVTNRHVLEGATEVTLQFVRDEGGKPVLGDAVQVRLTQLDPSVWYGHPKSDVDVAVLPLGVALGILTAAGRRPFYRALPESLLPSDAVINDLDALERVIFIGYPAGLYDSTNLTPIARQGLTATPIALDYKGLPAFVIDAAVFPGSSGSPVFLFDRGMIVDRAGNVTIGSRLYLLGVLAAVHANELQAEVSEVADHLVAKFRQPIGLGIVFKASAVRESVDLVLSQHGFHRTADQAAAVPQEVPPDGTSADREIAQNP